MYLFASRQPTQNPASNDANVKSDGTPGKGSGATVEFDPNENTGGRDVSWWKN